MADSIANIKVNTNSSGVSSGSDDAVLKELQAIRKAIQEQTGESERQSSIKGAGFGSAISRIAGIGIGGAAAALLGGASSSSSEHESNKLFKNAPDMFGAGLGDLSFEKVIGADGEEQVAVINEKTGELADLLSEEEARERGILDEKGDIHGYLKTQGTLLDEIGGTLAKSKDAYVLELDELDEIVTETKKQKKLQKAITRAMERKLNRLGGGGVDLSVDEGDNVSSATGGYTRVNSSGGSASMATQSQLREIQNERMKEFEQDQELRNAIFDPNRFFRGQ